MRKFPVALLSLILLFLFFSSPMSANSFDFLSINSDTLGSRLLREFVENMDPKNMEMIISSEPDKSGMINHIYLDIHRPVIGGIRIEKLQVEGSAVKFTPPGTWNGTEIDVEDVLYVKAYGKLTEEDINRSLNLQEFGEDERWHGLNLDFRDGKIYAEGHYLANLLFIKLDILIEINGEFGVVDRKQIWLENYEVKINRKGVPKGLSERAISKIQPILDLSEFVFPLEIHSVEVDEKAVTLRSRFLPNPFEGLNYRYERPEPEKLQPESALASGK